MACQSLICSHGTLWSAYTHLICVVLFLKHLLSLHSVYSSCICRQRSHPFQPLLCKTEQTTLFYSFFLEKYTLCSPHLPHNSQVNLFQFIFICPGDRSQSTAVTPQANIWARTCSSFASLHCCFVLLFLLVCILRLILIFRCQLQLGFSLIMKIPFFSCSAFIFWHRLSAYKSVLVHYSLIQSPSVFLSYL